MTMTVKGIVRSQRGGFWRRLAAGLFDLLFSTTVAMVQFLEVVLVVPVAMCCGWVAPRHTGNS
jgi:hypothetical protein